MTTQPNVSEEEMASLKALKQRMIDAQEAHEQTKREMNNAREAELAARELHCVAINKHDAKLKELQLSIVAYKEGCAKFCSALFKDANE